MQTADELFKELGYDEKCADVINAIEHILSSYKRVLKENEKLKNIRYDTPYGTETIHLIPESNLIEINTHKYMIEVEPGKFVDLKQVYLENKKLNEYKENYIPVQGIKDELEELKGKLEDISKRREKSKTKEEETVLWCLEIRTDERIKTLHELSENYKMNPKQ